MTQQQIHLRVNRQRRLARKINDCKAHAFSILKEAQTNHIDPNQQNLDVIQNQIGRLTARQSQLA